MRRVVVTGLGLVSPLGCDLGTFWERLIKGESGIGPVTRIDPAEYASRIAGEVKEFDPAAYVSPKEMRRMDPFTVYALAATQNAIADAGLDPAAEDTERVGVLYGSGIGGLQVLFAQSKLYVEKGPSRFSPFMIPQMITNIAAGHIAIQYGFKGPNFCITSACATATHCIGESLRLIQHGEADVIVAGGSEAPIMELGLGGFCALRALSTRNDAPQQASRPFDRERDGFVIAEGGATLILEEYEHAVKRGANIYCELAGYGRTCDAYHITAPDSEATGASKGMELAMRDARVDPAEVDYINAHGTSTELNDACETKAIKKALGEDNARKVMINSTKSMIGHTLGAAGGMESIVCALSIKHQALHPTINLDNPDPACDLDYVPHAARETRVRVCLNNSLGFGGHNATLCFKALD